MWTANAATCTPSEDSADGKMHLVPANLTAMFHRAIEADVTAAALGSHLPRSRSFHRAPAAARRRHFSDEGAANHTRLFTPGSRAVHLYAWGRQGFGAGVDEPRRFPARQTREASQALARLGQVDPARALFPRQHPLGIDAGAFHTDVLAVGNAQVLLLHELAFAEHQALLQQLSALLGEELVAYVASERELPAAAAVAAYPFNSQLLSLPTARCASSPRREPRTRRRPRLPRAGGRLGRAGQGGALPRRARLDGETAAASPPPPVSRERERDRSEPVEAGAARAHRRSSVPPSASTPTASHARADAAGNAPATSGDQLQIAGDARRADRARAAAAFGAPARRQLHPALRGAPPPARSGSAPTLVELLFNAGGGLLQQGGRRARRRPPAKPQAPAARTRTPAIRRLVSSGIVDGAQAPEGRVSSSRAASPRGQERVAQLGGGHAGAIVRCTSGRRVERVVERRAARRAPDR